MAAPKGNRFATTHGKRGYLTIGSLPKGASYIRRILGDFERALIEAVQAKNGEMTLTQSALIQTAIRHEGRAQLLTRWLRIEGENGSLKVLDRLSVLREIGSASDRRDKVIELLALDRENGIMAAFYEAKQPPKGVPDDDCDEEMS